MGYSSNFLTKTSIKDKDLKFHLAPELPEQSQQIFANRDLRLDQIDMIGFDMDYTLAIYKKVPMETLAHQLTVERMVSKLNYPQDILKKPYDPAFVIRGLIVDKPLGNILKTDKFNHVGRAFHGRRLMNKEERRNTYRQESLRLNNPRFTMVDTLFALPEMCLYADLVELIEKKHKPHSKKDFEKLFYDIRHTIDEVHRDESLKSIIIGALETYIEKDNRLAQTLHRLRSSGKKLFLLTNSHWHYTDHVMTFLLDNALPQYSSWRHYFDFIIVDAQKPKWFSQHDHPLEEIQTSENKKGEGIIVHGKKIDKLNRGKVYQHGSMKELENLTKIMGERILYVGDHIYGDILKTKKSGLWRTALIVSELEEEVRLSQAYQKERSEVHLLEDKQRLIDQELMSNKSMMSSLEQIIGNTDYQHSEKEIKQLIEHLKTLRKERDEMKRTLEHTLMRLDYLVEKVESAFNPYWGRIFKENHENTKFAAQVNDYACIYTSRVSNFSYYSPYQYFRAPRTLMPHER